MGCVCNPIQMKNSEIKVNLNENYTSLNNKNINQSTFSIPSCKEELKSRIFSEKHLKEQNKNNLNISIEKKLKNINAPTFNYPEVEEEVGEGLKKMHGYISRKSLFELEDVRNQFWNSAKEGDQKIWEELRKICQDETITDEQIIEKLEDLKLTPLHNCLNVCIDEKGNIYEIPNYCIQNPYEYNLRINDDSDDSRPSQNDIDVNVSYLKKNFSIKMSNVDTILDIKAEILNMDEFKNVEDNHISLFYKEQELQDNKEIWNYDINNESTINLIVKNNDN